MRILAVDTLIICWVCLLLVAPTLAWRLMRRDSAISLAGGTTLTASVIAGVTTASGLLHVGTLWPLRVTAAILALSLAFVVLGLIARRSTAALPWLSSREVATGVLATFLGIWVIVPAALFLRKGGAAFGMASLGNADLPFYVLWADNAAVAGFGNAQHIAQSDLGETLWQWGYLAPIALINLVSAATGLATWQASLLSMGVAVALLSLGVSALVDSLWPDSDGAYFPSIIGASLAGLSSYIYGQFYLGQVIGLAGIITAVAGATSLVLARGEERTGASKRRAIAEITGGGALAVYGYGHLALAFLLVLPLWAVAVSLLTRWRDRETLVRAGGTTVFGVVGALGLAVIGLPTAWRLAQLQSHNAAAGWPIPPMSSANVLFWPRFVPPFDDVGGGTLLVASTWLFIGLIAAIALGFAHARGSRDSARVAALVIVGCTALALAGALWYGPGTYLAWKLQSYLLPVLLAALLPALSQVTIAHSPVGRSVLWAAAGAMLLSPSIAWAATPRSTSDDLVDLADSPAITRLSSVNVHIPDMFEAMAVGAVIRPQTTFTTRKSYFTAYGPEPEPSPTTCTLMRAAEVEPNTRGVRRVNPSYVLVPRPARCAVR